MRRRIAGFAVLVVVLALGAATATATASAKPAPDARPYFISLGDSYSVGYQSDVGHTTLNGPASQLVKLAARRGYRFKLVSFGCGGATTTSMLTQQGCPKAGRLPGAAGFPGQTQVQAAVAFIKRHPGKVGLVTISIGGNDVDGCLAAPDPLGCVGANMPKATANLTKIVKRLRWQAASRCRSSAPPTPMSRSVPGSCPARSATTASRWPLSRSPPSAG